LWHSHAEKHGAVGLAILSAEREPNANHLARGDANSPGNCERLARVVGVHRRCTFCVVSINLESLEKIGVLLCEVALFRYSLQPNSCGTIQPLLNILEAEFP